MRAAALTVFLLLAACNGGAPADLASPAELTLGEKQQAILADARELCRIVEEHYIYYPSRASTWPQACEEAEEAVSTATSSAERLAVLEMLIDALYDPHVSLNTNSGSSPRLVPSGSDYWIEDGMIVAVRPNSSAAATGLTVGMKVIELNGVAISNAGTERIRPEGITPTDEQLKWAINASAAGYRGRPRTLIVSVDDAFANVTLNTPVSGDATSPINHRLLDGDIAYVRLNNSLGNTDTVAAFNTAANEMQDAAGWILDLRDTPGGGGTDIAEPIMGRFITEETPYQTIIPKDKPAWQRTVSPAGEWTITAPLVVLAGRWTGSMGEGMTIGFDGMGRGHVIGTEMAGLAGGVETFTLPATGIGVNIPTYDLAHLNGTPRHHWKPSHITIADNGNGPDIALQEATAWLKEAIAKETPAE